MNPSATNEKQQGQDIHIISQSDKLNAMLKSDPVFMGLRGALHNVSFAKRITPQERAAFCAGQHYIIVAFIDADPGNAPWGSYERLETEARSKGAKAIILPVWNNMEEVLQTIKDEVVIKLRNITAMPATAPS